MVCHRRILHYNMFGIKNNVLDMKNTCTNFTQIFSDARFNENDDYCRNT